MAGIRLRLSLVVAAVVSPTAAAQPLPPGAVARLGDHRFYHGPGLTTAVISPDGRRIASVAEFVKLHHFTEKARDAVERTVVLWDAATGARLRELKVEGACAWGPSFSPDSRLLAVVDSDGVTLFDVETGRNVRRMANDAVHDSPCFTSDGKELWAVNWLEPSVSAWEVASGKRLRKWTPPAGASEWVKKREQVVQTEVSPDGRRIAWLLGVGPDYSAPPPGTNPTFPFTPAPSALVVTDTVTGRPLYRRGLDGGYSPLFAFTSDGGRYVRGGEKTRVWDAATGRELSAIDTPGAFQLAVAPGGQKAAIGVGDRVRLWDLDTGKAGPEWGTALVHLAVSQHQAFPADSGTLLTTAEGTLRLFDTATAAERGGAAHRTPIEPRFSADGRTLFTTCDELRCRWELTAGGLVLKDRTPRRAWEVPRSVLSRQPQVLSPDERLFLDYFNEKTVRVRETATGRDVRELGASDPVYGGVFSPDAGRVLLRWSHRGPEPVPDPVRARLYDVATGVMTGEFPTPEMCADGIDAVAFSPDGRMVGWVDRKHAVHLHDAATGRAVRTLAPSEPLPPDRCDLARLVFSPDGTRVLVATDFHRMLGPPEKDESWANLPVRVLRVADGKELARFDADPKAERAGEVTCAAWSPDGRLIAIAGEGSGVVHLLDADTGRSRAEFAGHRDGVRGPAFAPDGRTLASGGEDNVVFLWAVPAAGDRK